VSGFRPTAKISTLKQRAKLLHAIRRFFLQQGYWEVETPILSQDIVIDLHLDPFTVAHTDSATSNGPLYLQTSPEFAMKRLVASGADAIFQITHAFRQGECGRYHNPEFSMLEWYRVGDDHHQQINFVQQLVQYLSQIAQRLVPVDAVQAARFCKLASTAEYLKLTYDEAFREYAGMTVLDKDCAALASLAAKQQVNVPESLDRDDPDSWLSLLLAELVEPQLGKDMPTYMHDYPASQSALARVSPRPDGIQVAERFELYIDGLELCNGYHELTDPDVFEARMQSQSVARQSAGKPALPLENRLHAAMQSGLPNCSGVALGLDRLVMLALGCRELKEVIPFPVARA